MLEVKNLSVTYGFHRALEGVEIAVDKGEICVILGANGAGKSSLLKSIAGMEKPDPGSEIVMNGKSITRLKPHKIVEAGIALVPEGRGIFGDLSVAENLQLGAFAARARGDEAKTLRLIYELFPRLAERKKQVARTMSGGEQQMVAIGRALMSKPDILMLDEPSLGLSPLLSLELFRSLAEVAETGVGILLVEQNAKQSLKIAERGYLIENGHVVGEGSASALANDPAVIAAYLGGGAGVSTKPRIALPPAFHLPVGLAAIGQSVGALGLRAGDIQRAFVRAARRESALPSAFVGRYDPKSGPDPWEEIAVNPAPIPTSRPPRVPSDARSLAGGTTAMAERAAERLAAHVRSSRLSAVVPSAFAGAGRHQVPPSPAPRDISPSQTSDSLQSPADLARRASERMSAHIARIRASSALPSAFATSHAQQQRDSQATSSQPSGRHSQIGHNSAAFGVTDEPDPEPVLDTAAGLSIADIVARAAAIHSAHIARQRKAHSTFPSAEERQRLTVYKMPALKPAPYESGNTPARDGQDTSKET